MQEPTSQAPNLTNSFYQSWWFPIVIALVVLLFTGLEIWRRKHNKTKQAELEKGRQQIKEEFKNPGGYPKS